MLPGFVPSYAFHRVFDLRDPRKPLAMIQENQTVKELAALSTGMVTIILNQVLIHGDNETLLSHRTVNYTGILNPTNTQVFRSVYVRFGSKS